MTEGGKKICIALTDGGVTCEVLPGGQAGKFELRFVDEKWFNPV